MRIQFLVSAAVAVMVFPAVANADAYSEMVVVEATDPSELTVAAASRRVEADRRDGGAPAVAGRRRERTLSCKQRIRQIVAFDDQVDLANAQGNRTWEDATWGHIDRLEGKLAQRCPEYFAERRRQQRAIRLARQARLAVRVAGEAAKRFFTGGFLPPGL
jgi:hypothetical protein